MAALGIGPSSAVGALEGAIRNNCYLVSRHSVVRQWRLKLCSSRSGGLINKAICKGRKVISLHKNDWPKWIRGVLIVITVVWNIIVQGYKTTDGTEEESAEAKRFYVLKWTSYRCPNVPQWSLQQRRRCHCLLFPTHRPHHPPWSSPSHQRNLHPFWVAYRRLFLPLPIQPWRCPRAFSMRYELQINVVSLSVGASVSEQAEVIGT